MPWQVGEPSVGWTHLVARADRGARLNPGRPDYVTRDVPTVQPLYKPRVYELPRSARFVQLVIPDAVGVKGHLLQELEEDFALWVCRVRNPSTLQ